MRIMMIKEPSFLRNGVVKVLEEQFVDSKVLVYDSSDFPTLLSKKVTADLVIIDGDVNINLLSVSEHFLSQNKKVVVWLSHLDENLLTKLFKSNLSGYFYNGMSKEELLSAVQQIMNGKKYIHSTFVPVLHKDYVQVNKKMPKMPVGILSPREQEVLKLLAKGFSNLQVADSLCISDRTVKNHVSNIIKKTNSTDRTNVVLKAIRNNWVAI